MEGIGALWVIIMIVSAVVSTLKKKQQQQQAQQKKNAFGASQPVRQQAHQAPARPAAVQRQPDREHSAPQAAPVREAAHVSKPLEPHMHEAAQLMGQEGVGTEGMDCCHDYMLTGDSAEEQTDLLMLSDKSEEERAQSLLQGVIFSEILGRRPMKKYGGHQA
ncbi:MAG: hypothetical protein J5472_06035 [Clostridia bacterium]|nr:hypothetical protein [Clostridia bacterium]